MADNEIQSVLTETRRFPPLPTFSAAARVKTIESYRALYAEAEANLEGFWARQARELLLWHKPFTQTLEWEPTQGAARWFADGTLNVSENCLDRHLSAGGHEKAALVFEGEPGDVQRYTYGQLYEQVCRAANGLRQLGVSKGDRVAIYLPMIPEAVVAMLACSRVGAIHSVVFGGFSSDALASRIQDLQARVLITADGGWRRGQVVPLKKNADAAVIKCPSVEWVLVVERTGDATIRFDPRRDVRWSELLNQQSTHCPALAVEAEHPLFVLYTSGTTGKPKGIVHGTAGYLLGALYTTQLVFDLRPATGVTTQDDVGDVPDLYFCTADIGWITGHSYVVYGPLAAGGTIFIYEGAPNYPEPDRLWEMIARHRITILYTAPTAIRSFMRAGDEHPKKHDLTSLRLLGSVGEPINPEAWIWYREVIGGGRCPIVDTWWQTETGAILIAPLPGATDCKPGSATLPLPGIFPRVVKKDGSTVDDGQGGFLVLEKPWPSMLRGIYGDQERYVQQYWSEFPGRYFTGDGARRDADGYFWIMGRVDDVLNVAGHRLGTMEIESALVSHPAVAEAAVVGKPDDLKGTAITAFVSLRTSPDPGRIDQLKDALKAHVVREIGAIARPDEICFADALPKTRSGKIMRRLLRDIAAGRESQGDVSTLEDLSALTALREAEEE